ncbi:four helix bundle protein [Niabella ginsengisoli]|uniref:Four helix bundle protein n=1 Tax=Niabella ginsengisoli TaxID=522298 RepID=A0ABS9SJK8_9BACT|nr:four helix bundle protein [Niabella ginsengisoli]MCH5598532.1 four helix bundle protein [Niabella ginsengisoli]
MHNYRELLIWKRSMDFVVRVYEVSTLFPVEEKYGLTVQLRNCSVSIPSNIAEGAGRGSNKQFKRFLEFSMGSINEAQTQIELAFRFKYLTKEHFEILIDEAAQIYKMTLAFYNGLKD